MKINRFVFSCLFWLIGTQILCAFPVVTSVSPDRGVVAGGNIVTLSGSGFMGTTDITFGDEPSPAFTIVDNFTITATVPPGIPGTVNVIVTAVVDSSPTPNNYYSYTATGWQALASVTTPDEVALFATDTNTFNTFIPLPGISVTSVMTPNGKRIYTGNGSPPGVSVINVATNTIITTIPTAVSGPGAFASATSPTGSRIYISHIFTGFLTIIDTATNTIVDDVFVAPLVSNISLTPDGTMLYVGNFGAQTVVVLDMGTNTIINTIPVGGSSGMISITNDGKKAFDPILENNTVVVISTLYNLIASSLALVSHEITQEKIWSRELLAA